MAALLELLADHDNEVSTAAACALGRMGRAEARSTLKVCLSARPSPRVIEALGAVADDEAIVLLTRLASARPELTVSIVCALDEIEDAKAAAAASRLKKWLSASQGQGAI